jgi:hypothetical protein
MTTTSSSNYDNDDENDENDEITPIRNIIFSRIIILLFFLPFNIFFS